MADRKNAFALLLLSSICVPLFAASVNAGTTITITTPSKDTYIDNTIPDPNYGLWRLMYVGADYPGYYCRSLVQFDLPPEISGKIIVSAVLRLRVSAPWFAPGDPSGLLLRACRVTHDWVEGDGTSPDSLGKSGATWNEYDKSVSTNVWTTPGADYTPVDSSTTPWPSPLSADWANFTVTSIVQGWAIGSSPNYGFIIKLDDESVTWKGGTFITKENGGLEASMLEITWGVDFVVPEVPLGTAMASAAMIIGLAAYFGIPRLPRLNRKTMTKQRTLKPQLIVSAR